jgi:hypothetical protein
LRLGALASTLSTVTDVSPETIAKIMAIEPTKRREMPLRMAVAARIAFPDGTMGSSGLRKERERGRLVTEMIAGKEYTTLGAIEHMRELCRFVPKVAPDAKPAAASAQAAARAKLARLRERL